MPRKSAAALERAFVRGKKTTLMRASRSGTLAIPRRFSKWRRNNRRHPSGLNGCDPANHRGQRTGRWIGEHTRDRAARLASVFVHFPTAASNRDFDFCRGNGARFARNSDGTEKTDAKSMRRSTGRNNHVVQPRLRISFWPRGRADALAALSRARARLWGKAEFSSGKWR